MRRLAPVLLVFPLACATAAESGESTVPPSPQEAPDVAAASPTGEAIVGLEGQLSKDALAATAVEKIKLRFDAQGTFEKQAVYHDNAAAVPQPVVDRALAVYPGGKAVRYETEFYNDDGLVYEVEVETADGLRCEVSSTSDGTLRYQECRVDPASLPAPVREKISADYPGATVLEAEKKTGPGIDVFSVEVEAGGKEFYVQIAPDGVVRSVHQRFRAVVEIPVAAAGG